MSSAPLPADRYAVDASPRPTSEWVPSPAGFCRSVAGFELAVTDQNYRGCGWCWHVSLTEPDRNGEYGELEAGAGKTSADEAKHAAEDYARDFCARVLRLLGEAV
jgi:hypothetical protein